MFHLDVKGNMSIKLLKRRKIKVDKKEHFYRKTILNFFCGQVLQVSDNP